MRVLAVDGSPTGGRTKRVLQAVLEGAASAGATTSLVSLAETDAASAVQATTRADALVLGTPVYRASYTAQTKAFLDALPRGFWGETEAPITGRAVSIVATGASWHHFLALNDLRDVLSTFFGAWVVPPGLYLSTDGFAEDKQLTGEARAAARREGETLVALASAIAADEVLAGVRPQV